MKDIFSKKTPVDTKDELFRWSPLRWAEERNYWQMVDKLLKIDAGFASDLNKLNNMSKRQINSIKMDFIKLPNLGSYIFSIRSDIIINHEMLVLVFEEHYPDDILKKVLNLAVEQQLDKHYQFKNELHSSALHMAALTTKDPVIFEILVKKLCFDVNEKNFHGVTPLLFSNSVEAARSLIQLGADPDYYGSSWSERHLFLNACDQGNIELMRFYLDELNTDINRLGEDGLNAMHFACRSGNLEAVKLLYSKGFTDLNKKSESGETPLMLVKQKSSSVEIVNFFLEHNADVTTAATNGVTLLDKLMAIDDAYEICTALVENGSKINACVIVSYYDLTKIKHLDLISPIDWNSGIDLHGHRCLHTLLMQSRDLEILEYVATKCDIDQRSVEGYTPLHLALSLSTPIEFAAKLLDLGADIHKIDNKGKTSLHHACRSCNVDKLKLVMSKGLNVNAKDDTGQSSIHYCYSSYTSDCARYLIECGMDVNATDNNGRTALHQIMLEKPWDYMWAVKDAMDGLKIDPSIRDNRNRLAIHYLVESEGSRGLEPLRAYAQRCPIDFDAKDNDGKTVLDLTENNVLKDFLLEIKKKTVNT